MVYEKRERERASRIVKIYIQRERERERERVRDGIFREPYFFAQPSRGWYRADLKHLIFVSSSTSASLVHLDFSTSQPRAV